MPTGIERLRIRNYRVLRDVVLDELTPVTVLLGPNGSGKSTVFDAVRFVYEALGGGLGAAWDRRRGLAEIRTRGATEPVMIELGCRVNGDFFTYLISVDEEDGSPVVVEEKLTWKGAGQRESLDVLEFSRRRGTIRRPGAPDERQELTEDGVLGVGTFGQLAPNALIAQFLQFAGQIHLADLDIARMRLGSSQSRGTRLDPNGDNLAVRVQHLKDESSDSWSRIRHALQRYVPGLDDFDTVKQGDGNRIVLLKELGSDKRIRPENISDGTMKLLGLLVSLRDPGSLLLLEEPENQVHPSLPYLLAEDIRGASESGQVIVATHSPYFVDALRPDEVWMMFRDESGAAQARRAAGIPQLMAMVEAGGLLGSLWTEGYFDLGDPLVRSGRPQ